MAVYYENSKIKDAGRFGVYKGSQPISKIYKGSQLVYTVYDEGYSFLETSTAGTYTINLITEAKLNIILVGAGGGYATSHGGYWTQNANGGSGGLITGTITLPAGSYKVTVGSGGSGSAVEGGTAYGRKGGDTSFAGQTAGGGGGGTADYLNGSWAGAGGTCIVTETTLIGSNGSAGSTTPRYENYGGGNSGQGYVKIVATL